VTAAPRESPAESIEASLEPSAVAANRRLAEAAVLLVTVIWGVNYVVVKAALAEAPPVAFQALRFSVASLLLLGFLRWREGGIGLRRRDILPMALLGFVGFGAYQALWSLGLVETTAGNSALIVAATPVLTILISASIGTDRLTPSRALGAAISFGGVLVVVGASAAVGGGNVLGDALTLAAALCWAIYVSFGANALRRLSPLRATTWTVTFGTLALWPLALLELTQAGGFRLAADGWLAVLFSGLLSVAVANVLVFHAIKLLGPVRISAFQFLSPVVAVVVGALWLHEAIRFGQIVGGLLIGAGILVLRRAPRRTAADEPAGMRRARPARIG